MAKGFINIYKSGYWHRAGKPGAYDRHGGDVYATAAAAFNAIEQGHLYVGVAEVEWPEDEVLPVNFDPRMMDVACHECESHHYPVVWLTSSMTPRHQPSAGC